MNLEEMLYREKLVLATIPSRILAFLIDQVLLSFVFALIYWNELLALQGTYTAIIEFFNQVAWQFLVLIFVYEVLFLVLYGATLGKIVCKIKVISTTLLDHPSLIFALIRTAFKILGGNLFYAPFLLVFFTPFKQSLHDFLGKTIVIKYA